MQTDSLSVIEEAFDQEQERLRLYLLNQCANRETSEEVTQTAWTLWTQFRQEVLRQREKVLPVPSAMPTPDGSMLYAWNKAEHHFELEILSQSCIEAFYMNMITKELWEAVYSIEEGATEDILDHAVRVL